MAVRERQQRLHVVEGDEGYEAGAEQGQVGPVIPDGAVGDRIAHGTIPSFSIL